MPNPDGITPAEFLAVIEGATAKGEGLAPLLGVIMVEIDPEKDIGNKTGNLAIEGIATAFRNST